MLKNHLPDRKRGLNFLGWEDPLEREMVTHSSILPGNPMDRGDWWAIVYGVTKESRRDLETKQQPLLTRGVRSPIKLCKCGLPW